MGNWQPEQPCHAGFCEERGELWESLAWCYPAVSASTASDSSIRLGLLFRGIIFYLLHNDTHRYLIIIDCNCIPVLKYFTAIHSNCTSLHRRYIMIYL